MSLHLLFRIEKSGIRSRANLLTLDLPSASILMEDTCFVLARYLLDGHMEGTVGDTASHTVDQVRQKRNRGSMVAITMLEGRTHEINVRRQC